MADVAREYGSALFELAQEEGIEADILDEIISVRGILNANPDFMKLLDSPNINLDERLHIIDEAFKGKIHNYLCSFLKLLTERRHTTELFECFSEYEKCYENRNSIVEAYVNSAVELSEKQKEELSEKLSRQAGKKVLLKYIVDPDLIGGIKVNMDGVLYEGTIRARLDELRSNLKKETL